MVLFKGTNLERSTSGLSMFCARLVDKVWQGVYLRPTSEVYTFLLSLVEQAQKSPNLLPLGDLQRSMNRLILYQVSTVPTSEADQKALVDTLCLFSSQAHVIFDETNMDSEFLKHLTFRLMKMAVSADRKEDLSLPSEYVSIMSLSMMKSGANRLWNKMLEYKHEALEQILSVELPMPKLPHQDTTAMPEMLRPILSGGSSHILLQNCSELMSVSERLEKAWDVYESGESALHDASSRGSSQPRKAILFRTSRKKDAGLRGRSTTGEVAVMVSECVCCKYVYVGG